MAAPWLSGSPFQGPRSPVWIRFGTRENISEHQVYSADRQSFQGGLRCVFPQTWTAHGFFAVKSPIPSAFTVRRNPGTRQHLSQLLSPWLLPRASGRKQRCFKTRHTPLPPEGLSKVTTLPLQSAKTLRAVAVPNQPLLNSLNDAPCSLRCSVLLPTLHGIRHRGS